MTAANSQIENNSVRFVRGIGPKRAEALKRLNIESIKDLCYFFPRRYEDRSHLQPISSIAPGGDVTIKGEVFETGLRPTKRISIFELIVADETGAITAVWFNQPYLKNQFKKGDRIILAGKVERYQNRLQFTSPEYELITDDNEEENQTVHTGRITPIYPLTEGLAQRSLRAAMKEVIDRYLQSEIKEFLSGPLRKDLDLMDLETALRTLHFPDDLQLIEDAKRRIVFDEFFLFELHLLSRIYAIRRKETSFPLENGEQLLAKFKTILPFELTTDQLTAVDEILKQVSGHMPMNRLLQGEVGSGKTIIAAFFLALAAENKMQSVLLAPTEILAGQHYQNLKPFFSALNMSVELLTGGLEEENKARIHKIIESGKPAVMIGTHALLQEEVKFQNLGLVVIDEQHRFGVRQRAKLVQRTPRPHLLVMTATPIPRTLGLTLYGDLDISTIKTLPKGRKPIKTFWIDREKEKEIFEHIRDRALNQNEQAYILFPMIDENEALELQAAAKEYERLSNGIMKNVPIGLVHGRLAKNQIDDVMQKFYKGEIKILVATTVIEVGVDNPNVTSMVIENADRFGLSQLHQIRGRIGRGTKESTCFLFAHPTTDEAKKRLRILTKTNDGFVIAEEDLKLRGPGDFFGTKQSGVPFFQLADLTRDTSLLLTARKEAGKILTEDPSLSNPVHKLVVEEIAQRKNKYRFP